MAGTSSLGKAVLIISTETGEFTSGIASAERQALGFERTVNGIGGSISSLGKMIAGAFAVTAILDAGKAALDYAGHISDLSARLKIGTSTAQEWESVFGAAGVSIDAVAKAAEKLTINLVSGDKSTVEALKKMGLSVEALRAMNPEERFNKVADAVGRIQDAGEQLYASKALFGKGGPELLAALDGNLESNIQNMRDLGLVISDETIGAADEFGDTLGFIGKQLMAILGSVVGPLLPALSALGNVLLWIGANIVGPVLNVAVKGTITLLTAFWQTLSGLLSKVAELGAMLPGIGGRFQQLADFLKNSSQASGDYIARLWKETDKTGQSADTAAPKLLGLGDATETAGKRAESAGGRVRGLKQAVEDTGVTVSRAGQVFGTFVLTMEQTRNLSQGLTADGVLPMAKGFDVAAAAADNLRQRQEALARTQQNLARMIATQSVGLMPGQTGLRGVDTEIAATGSRLGGLFGQVRDFMGNIPRQMGELQGKVSGGLMRMFGATPDSMLGSIMNGGLSMVFGPLTGLVSQWAMKGMQALGEVVWGGLKKIGGFFRQVFGGPSAQELAGRDIVSAFESNLAAMLTEQQRLAAGGESWKQTVIAIRDRYIEMGLTEQEALADAERLWKSSKEGAEASKRVIEEIQRKFGERGITVPVSFDFSAAIPDDLPIVPMADGGVGRVSRPTLFLAGEDGAEDFAFSGGGRRFGSAEGGGGTAVLMLNDRVLAEAVVPQMPGVMRRYGLK